MTDPTAPQPDDLRLLSIAIDGVIAQTCARHYDAETQEHHLTSRIAQAIEHELDGLIIGRMKIHVTAQELSDKGRGAKEKKIGADLYVSVVTEDGQESVSKGLLVQSKWDDALDRPSEQARLDKQVHDMLQRTDESYVFLVTDRLVRP